MKSIKLSPFAAANIQSMTPVQTRSVGEAIRLLQADGIHSRSLEIDRLPSKQGYVVKAKSGTRLTVMHEGGGHLLVDDVFVSTSTAAKKAFGFSITAQKTATPHSGSVGQKFVKPTVTGLSTRGQVGTDTFRTTSAKKSTVKKVTAAKTT